jgi:hypothetical protein
MKAPMFGLGFRQRLGGFRDFRKEVRGGMLAWNEYAMGVYGDSCGQKKASRIGWALWVVRMHLCALECVFLGHKIVCDDWAGPDSGGMGAHCERCPWGFEHTLY